VSRAWRWGSYAALAAAAAAALAAPGAVDAVLWVPLLAGLIVIGMPHGAIDHLVPGRVRGRPLAPRAMAALLAGDGGLAAAGVALWLAAPAAGVVALVVVAALHWGQGELFLLGARSRARAAAEVAARGLLPVAGPLAFHPDAFARAADGVLEPFGATLALPAGVPAALGAATLLAAAAAGALALAEGDRTSPAELAGLAAFFAVVPPVFAVGVYFVAWHSLRHVARLVALDPSARGVPGFARDAAPCTAVALAGVAALGAVLAVDPGAAAPVAGVALAVVFGLTLPHALVVAWMDRPGALKGDPIGADGRRSSPCAPSSPWSSSPSWSPPAASRTPRHARSAWSTTPSRRVR